MFKIHDIMVYKTKPTLKTGQPERQKCYFRIYCGLIRMDSKTPHGEHLEHIKYCRSETSAVAPHF